VKREGVLGLGVAWTITVVQEGCVGTMTVEITGRVLSGEAGEGAQETRRVTSKRERMRKNEESLRI
jgi:hypothetical protein